MHRVLSGVDNCKALVSPLKTFVWSPACQAAFESAKALLCSTPVLGVPRFTRPLKLEVDASTCGAGAVLLQEDEQAIDRPGCYLSKKFNKHQLNYSTIEKEALAFLLALQHFEVYRGSSSQPVQVFTDHNPLVFLYLVYPICETPASDLCAGPFFCRILICRFHTRRAQTMY